ncbi:nickel transport system permease protein [Streptococcus rupicaprae]|uniref:Nickel transport system permease protein n=1 Tax=Streptococcus rupicaprae TaxID=759619 RepID=A0ABV2FF24_9STRE
MVLSRLLKQVLSFLAALFLISALSFMLTKLTSANPAENYLRVSKIAITDETLKQATLQLGLDKPWLEQYLLWARRAVVGDFGVSYVWKTPVLPLVIDGFLSTLSLGFLSFCWVLLFSFPLGIISGLYKGTWLDKLIQLLSFTSVSLPTFWLGYLLMLVFGVYLKWVPVSGKSGAGHALLPSLTLSFSLIGQYTALIRRTISEQLTSVHVENARLRGVKLRFIIKNHLLPNALPAITTGLSLTAVHLMTGALIIEEVFSWSGLGHVFVYSLQTIDLPVIQACMLLFGSLFLLNNVFSKWLANWVDPRVRKGRRKPHG